MKKGLIAIMVLTLLLGFGSYTLVQQSGARNPCGGQQMMGQGQMGDHGMGFMGGGQGMMGGMGIMGQKGYQGMGMMGQMMGSPEIMGTMISIHGEIMSLMGQMMQKHGKAIMQMTPELKLQMHKEMLERIGDILSNNGAILKEKAKTLSR